MKNFVIDFLKNKKHLFAKELIFIWFLFFSIFPFLLITIFNQPSSDDFDFEFKNSITNIIQTQIDLYNNWSGRYFSIGVMTINPIYYIDYRLYKIIPFFIIAFFLLSMRCFIDSLFIVSKKEAMSMMGIIVFLFLFQIPSVSQAFYWYSGAACYQLGIISILFSFSFYNNFKILDKKRYYLFALIFLVAAIGSNEIIMLNILLIALLYGYKRKYNSFDLFMTLIVLAFSFIVISSPGNNVRLQREGIVVNHNLISSIGKSLFYSIKFIFKWIPIILVIAFFQIDNLYKLINSAKFKMINPIKSFIIVFGTLFLSLFIGFWTKNELLPERVLNVIYFVFLVNVLYFILCTVSFIKNRYNIIISISKSNFYFLFVIIFCFFLSENTISDSYIDLFSGKAYRYDKEMKDRFDIIRNSKDEKVIIPSLINQPKTIYNQEVMGITNDANNWKNLEISKYFKKTVIVEPLESTLTE